MTIFLAALLAAQNVPAHYVAAEQAARRAIEILGVPAQGVRVSYGPQHPDVNGAVVADNRIVINQFNYPSNAHTIYHEMWHHVQNWGFGGHKAMWERYRRFEYDQNPFEQEARLMGTLMRDHAGARESSLRALVRRAIPALRELVWKDTGVAPKHLDRLESRLDRSASSARAAAVGMAQFAAAYLLKEGLVAIETRDPERVRRAAGSLATPEFWGSMALFSGAAQLTQVVVSRFPAAGALPRTALPLAAGVAALHLATGRGSLRDLAIATGSQLAASLAVGLVMDGLVYPMLFAAGPPGWVAAGAYTVAKLALSLYVGEKLEQWLLRRTEHAGVDRKLGALAP